MAPQVQAGVKALSEQAFARVPVSLTCSFRIQFLYSWQCKCNVAL